LHLNQRPGSTGIENAEVLARTAVRALLLKRIGRFIVKVTLP